MEIVFYKRCATSHAERTSVYKQTHTHTHKFTSTQPHRKPIWDSKQGVTGGMVSSGEGTPATKQGGVILPWTKSVPPPDSIKQPVSDLVPAWRRQKGKRSLAFQPWNTERVWFNAILFQTAPCVSETLTGIYRSSHTCSDVSWLCLSTAQLFFLLSQRLGISWFWSTFCSFLLKST